QPGGYVSPSRNIHWSRSQRRKTSRPASDAGNQVRVGYQPKDCEGARPRNPADADRRCRRGDRIKEHDSCTDRKRAVAKGYTLIEDRSLKRLRKKASKGLRGWPIATIAFYGPNLSQATKVTVGIVPSNNANVTELRDWKVEHGDVRAEPGI